MADINDLRKLYPEFDQYGYSDSQVLEWVGGELGQDPMKLAEYYGLRDPDQGDFSRGISAGVNSTKAVGYGLVGLAGDAAGSDTVRDFGIRGYQANMDKVALNSRDTDGVEGVNGLGDAADFAQYYSGMALPQAATALISGGVGGLVAKQVVKGAVKKKIGDGLQSEANDLLATAAKRGTYGGVGTQSIGSELGATYGQAVEEAQANGESIDDINLGRVAGYGALAGSLEFVGDVATLGMARLGPASNLIDAARKTRTRGALTGLAGGSAVEGLTEGLQTGLEDMGAGRSLEEARFFDPTSVLAGAIGGGQLGGVGGALRAPTSSGTELDTPDAQNEVQEQLSLPLDNPNAGTPAETAQLAEAQAANERVVNAEAEALVASRLEAAKTYTPRKMFLAQRDKKLEEQNKIDIEDPSTEIYATFQEDLTARRAKGESFYDPVDIAGAKTKFLKDAAKGAKDEAGGNVAYEAALDEYTANLSNQQQELDFAQQNEAEKAAVVAQERQVIVDTPAKTTNKAIEKAEALYGEDWVNSGKYDDLASVVNGGRYRQKNFEAEIDKIENPPIDVNASTTTREQKLKAVVEAVERVSKGLTGKNDKRVFDTFAQAILSFDGDKYVEQRVLSNKKNGTGAISFTQLAKDAGVKDASSAQTVMARLAPKLAGALGITKEQLPTLIESLRPANVVSAQKGDTTELDQQSAIEDQAVDVDTGPGGNVVTDGTEAVAPVGTGVMDADELNDANEQLDNAVFAAGGGFQVKASVNQGATDGLSPEDVAYTEGLSNKVDPIYEQRVEEGKRRLAGENELMARNFLNPARKMWIDGVSEGGPRFTQLSAPDMLDWISSVVEHHTTNDDAQLAQDLREMEKRYDANNAGVTMEKIDEQTEEGSNDPKNAASPSRSEETGATTDTSTDTDGNPSGTRGKAKPAPKVENVVTAEYILAKNPDMTLEQAQKNAEEINKLQPKAKAVVVEKRTAKKFVNPNGKTKFGIPDAPVATATRAAFSTAIKKLTGETSNMRIHVFDTEADAIIAVETGVVPETSVDELKKAKPYGWVVEDSNGDPHAHFILERIAEGREKSAFMHEVGGHVGIDSVLDTDQQKDIARQIYEWAGTDNNSVESQIARRTISRIELATERGGVSDGSVVSEAIAYFLEEATIAGVEPSVDSALGKFLQKLKDLFVTALSKVGIGNTVDLTAQDVIDMAMGAARVELMHGQTDISMQSPFTSPSMTAATRYGINRDWVGENMGGPTAQKVYDNTAELAKKAALSTKFVHNIVRDVRETMPALGQWYDAMIKAEAVRNEIRQQFADVQQRARSLKSGRLPVVNKFLGESTFQQKWGYDPKEYHPDLFSDREVEIDTAKRLQFQRMSSDEKQLVADIFAHGERMRQRKVALAKKLGVAGKFFTDASLVGPYAPLKRFGNYAGELKSERLAAAEKASKAEGATKEQKDAYEKLKSDSDHYVISFFDTIGSAKEFVDQNKKNYRFSQASERAPNLESDRVSNPEVYEKVMAALAASDSSDMDSGAKTAFRDMVRGMYFQSMDERSARTSGAKRLNRAGYEQNMIRSFINHGKSEASLMAQMENGTEINTALAKAGNETLTETGEVRDPEKQRVFNSISKHYQNILKGSDTPVQDRLTTMNSVYMLLTSVGYHVTNATQPAMVTVPRIAGDFGNYSGTWSAMFRGYKVAMASSKLGLNMETSIDLEKAPTKYRALLKMLQDRQLIDQGMEEDGSFDRFNTGFDKLNQASDVLGTITGKLYNVAKFVESQNRISSAIAAYDMALSNPSKLAGMNMTAEQYATAVVEDTQGNFSQLDAPLLIKSLPKIVVQYRKYQLLMAWHYSNAFKQGFAGETPEIKAAGKRVMAYSIAHAALGAGATGVPLLSTAFWLTTFLGDEDEPQDMERWIKEKIDDGAFGTALSRGLFSSLGLDLSTKLNQSKIFHPLPYADFQAGEAGATDILMGLAGPAGTTGVNFFRAAEYFKQGDLLKGFEYSVPKGLRTVAESYRLATEGYTTKIGTVIVDPREIDSMSLLLNAMGLPATEINRIKWTRGQQYELQQYFNKEGSKIRKRYIEATKNRDRGAQSELRQEFRDLQKSKDRVRPFFNDAPGALNRQSLSTLLKAPKNREKLEAKEQLKLK